MFRKTLTTIAATSAIVMLAGYTAKPANAQKLRGCFIGKDYSGNPALLQITAEKYRNYFEIYGTLRSSSVGTIQVKADGWSGAGRMFRGHEHESGALYVRISNYTGSSLVLSVEGYGSFPFRKSHC